MERIKETDAKLANFVKAIEMGVINETTQSRMQELESQKSMLEDELLACQNRNKYSIKEETIVKFLDYYWGDVNDPANRERILDTLVDGVYVDNDSVTVTFYYSDDDKKVTFEDFDKMCREKKEMDKFFDGTYNGGGASSPILQTLLQSILQESETGGGTSDFFQ